LGFLRGGICGLFANFGQKNEKADTPAKGINHEKEGRKEYHYRNLPGAERDCPLRQQMGLAGHSDFE